MKSKIFTINVTNHDIKMGGNGCTDCPVYRAMQRKLKADHLEVFTCCASFYKGNTRYLRYLPEEARDFIEKFDKNKKVKPFKFKISL